MHQEPKTLLKQAIKTCLPVLQPMVGQFTTQHSVGKKTGEGRWNFTMEPRPDVRRVFRVAEVQIKEAGVAFGASFVARHPDHGGAVGFSGCIHDWAKSQGNIVRIALGALWSRHGTFNVSDAEVDAIVEEFSDFVDSSVIRLRYQVQLINFEMVRQSFDLPAGITIRRLSEEEVSLHHGAAIRTLGLVRSQPFGVHEFVIEGELDEPKLLGNKLADNETMSDRAKVLLDKAILCLRTFKEGPIGYDYVHFAPTKFCPLGLFSVGCGDRYVPLGSYSLSEADLVPLAEHAKLIFACTDKAMEMACSRLADAAIRDRPEDRIVDAVIGMESLLLAGLANEDRRSELSFRFSLNYSMIFKATEERPRAFRVARDLYSLRSVIAHGSVPDQDKLKVGSEKLTLDAAAKLAMTVLRTIIMHFLPYSGAPYKKPDFWQRKYFGLPEE